jgi:hypothetical protein
VTDLIAFITARLAEDQETARKAASLCGCHPPAPSWTFDDDESGGRILTAGRILIEDDAHPDVAHKLRKRWNGSYNDMFAADHIARHDPARVLREVEAKRRLLGQCVTTGPDLSFIGSDFHPGDDTELAAFTLALLALPYSDHPDWREEWRP